MDPFIGQILMFAGNFAPRNWALCDGQLLAIAQNQALFSILGTTYGGDGRTTFALPDLRGRVPVHPGSGPGLPTYRLGSKGGQAEVTLDVNQMPTHNHDAATQAVDPVPRGGLTNSPINAYVAEGGAYSTIKNAEMAADSVVVHNTGGNQPHNNMQPFQCVNYIIALQGVYPSRN